MDENNCDIRTKEDYDNLIERIKSNAGDLPSGCTDFEISFPDLLDDINNEIDINIKKPS